VSFVWQVFYLHCTLGVLPTARLFIRLQANSLYRCNQLQRLLKTTIMAKVSVAKTFPYHR